MNHPTKHIICLWAVLLAGVLACGLFAAEGPNSPDLDGRGVVVRVHDNWENDPAEFREAYAPIDGRTIVVDSNNIPESAFIVVVGEDQHDDVVKRFMGDRIWAEQYKEDLRIELRGGGASREQLSFRDAMGKPLSNANVEILLYAKDLGKDSRVFVREVTVGKSGRFVAPPVIGSLNRLYLIVWHPDNYGIVIVDPVALNWYKPTVGNYDTIKMPWVCRESKAYERSICGVVLNEANNPITGAAIDCSKAYDRDYFYQNFFYLRRCKLLTDEQGRFRVYVPLRKGNHKIGESVRLESKAPVQIDPPYESGLAPYLGTLVKDDECTTIRITDHGNFHTFAFEDRKGPITKHDRLIEIFVEVERRDNSVLKYRYDDLQEGRFLPMGTYKAYADWGKTYEFEPLVVTKDSLEKLVFRLEKGIIYRGRVVHGLTGEPMAGAFVIEQGSSNSMPGANQSQIRPDQWEILHRLPLNPSVNDPNLKLLEQGACLEELMRTGHTFEEAVQLSQEGFGFDQIVRTDPNSWFQMKSKPGAEIRFLVAFEEDYLGIWEYTGGQKPDSHGQVQVPTMPLFPAAKVKLDISLQGGAQRGVQPRWIIDTNNLPDWAGKSYDREPAEETFEWEESYRFDPNENLGEGAVASDIGSDFGFFLLRLLYDMFTKDTFYFFGIPVTVHQDYGWTSEPVDINPNDYSVLIDKSAGNEPNDDLIWSDELFEVPEDESNRVPTFLEIYERYYGFTYKQRVTPNMVHTFHVPAGVSLRLQVHVQQDNEDEWVPVTLPDVINLKQGETLDLGDCEIERSMRVFVKVVDSAGQPVANVPVHNWIFNRYWTHVYATDKNGRVRFNVLPNSKGRFFVSLEERALDSKDSISYEIGGEEDAGREFTLPVSDEMLECLFK